jgi:hypothetical protein
MSDPKFYVVVVPRGHFFSFFFGLFRKNEARKKKLSFSQDRSSSLRTAPYVLEPLPYPKNALGPWLTEETLDFHYGKHHQTYVTKLNQLRLQNQSQFRIFPHQMMSNIMIFA